VNEFYPGILPTMVTLIQFVILDSIREAYMPLVHQEPLIVLYYVMFMLVVSVSMMNLVTAVIVEGSLGQAKHDQQSDNTARMAAILPKLRTLFHDLDSDGNGMITMEEAAHGDSEARRELMKIVQADNLEELFDMLDVDGSGEVDIDEFLDGIVRVSTSSEPVRILKQLAVTRKELGEIINMMQQSAETSVQDSVQAVLAEVKSMNQATMTHMTSLSREMMELKLARMDVVNGGKPIGLIQMQDSNRICLADPGERLTCTRENSAVSVSEVCGACGRGQLASFSDPLISEALSVVPAATLLSKAPVAAAFPPAALLSDGSNTTFVTQSKQMAEPKTMAAPSTACTMPDSAPVSSQACHCGSTQPLSLPLPPRHPLPVLLPPSPPPSPRWMAPHMALGGALGQDQRITSSGVDEANSDL